MQRVINTTPHNAISRNKNVNICEKQTMVVKRGLSDELAVNAHKCVEINGFITLKRKNYVQLLIVII